MGGVWGGLGWVFLLGFGFGDGFGGWGMRKGIWEKGFGGGKAVLWEMGDGR